MKTKIIFKKLIRWLHITKPIELSKTDKQWIKLCKFHYDKKYKTTHCNSIDRLKPMFEEIYGWSPNEFYNEFLDCMFTRLLDLYLKIQYDRSGHNNNIKEIISSSFIKTVARDYEKPIERVISKLCSEIAWNTYAEDGIERYKLDID